MNSLRSQHNTFKCKVVLLGDQSVGKSSLVLRFVKNIFMEHHAPTIGAAFLTKHLPLDDCTIKFEIWDTAGQERFHSIAPMYYRGSQAAIVVYDITDENSFHKAKDWIKELYLQANSQLVILLAGNKADLAHERMVQHQEAASYAQEQNLLFLETSAKTEQNIDKVFREIGTHCPRKTEGSTASYNQTPVDLRNQHKENKCCKQS